MPNRKSVCVQCFCGGRYIDTRSCFKKRCAGSYYSSELIHPLGRRRTALCLRVGYSTPHVLTARRGGVAAIEGGTAATAFNAGAIAGLDGYVAREEVVWKNRRAQNGGGAGVGQVLLNSRCQSYQNSSKRPGKASRWIATGASRLPHECRQVVSPLANLQRASSITLVRD